MFKIAGSAKFTWGHKDQSCVERRVAGARTRCDRMLNRGWFSEQRMRLTNLGIRFLISGVILKVKQLLGHGQGLIRGFIK